MNINYFIIFMLRSWSNIISYQKIQHNWEHGD